MNDDQLSEALRHALKEGEASGIGSRSMSDIFEAARKRFEKGGPSSPRECV